jgi:hypothetical protein
LLVGTSYLLVSSLGEFCHEKEIWQLTDDQLTDS